MELTKTRFMNGVWEGLLTGAQDRPDLSVQHLGRDLAAPGLLADVDGRWHVEIRLPVDLLADGVQTVLVSDAQTGAQLTAIHIVAGEPLDDDLRAEVQLLREELDMLKRAFRRHCLETTQCAPDSH